MKGDLKIQISSQLLRCGKKSLAYILIYMPRCEIFSAPCIWANYEFLETPL